MSSYKKKITITRFLLERTLNMNNKKGVVLYFVLGVLFVVVLLANIVLNFVSSQSRLTSHQVKRVQAYYAAQAGVNYATEQLRLGNYTSGGTLKICGPNYSTTHSALCSGANFTEASFPSSINYVDIFVSAANATGGQTLNATVNYTSAY